MAKPNPRVFNTREVLELSFAAHRIKGGYSTSVVYPYNDARYYDRFTNKNLVLFGLVKESRPDDYIGRVIVSDEDRTNTEDMYRFFRRLSFDILGTELNDFEKSMAEVIISESINENQLGVAAVIPKIYFDRSHKKNMGILMSETKREWLGSIGEYYTFEMVLIHQRFVEKIGCYEHVGITGSNHLVSFLAQKSFGNAGDDLYVTAKVKAHDFAYQTDYNRTALHYVKKNIA